MNIWSSDTSSVRINHAIAPPKLDHLSEKCLRFLPHFHQSHICYIIEPKIAPFPISRNCPTLRLASLDTAMAYPVFLQKLIWGHSHGQTFIEWITYFSFFPHEHMRPLHKTSHFFVYSKNHPLIKTTVCPRGGLDQIHHKAQPPHKVSTHRSEERRVGKECRSRWSPYH